MKLVQTPRRFSVFLPCFIVAVLFAPSLPATNGNADLLDTDFVAKTWFDLAYNGVNISDLPEIRNSPVSTSFSLIPTFADKKYFQDAGLGFHGNDVCRTFKTEGFIDHDANGNQHECTFLQKNTLFYYTNLGMSDVFDFYTDTTATWMDKDFAVAIQSTTDDPYNAPVHAKWNTYWLESLNKYLVHGGQTDIIYDFITFSQRERDTTLLYHGMNLFIGERSPLWTLTDEKIFNYNQWKYALSNGQARTAHSEGWLGKGVHIGNYEPLSNWNEVSPTNTDINKLEHAGITSGILASTAPAANLTGDYTMYFADADSGNEKSAFQADALIELDIFSSSLASMSNLPKGLSQPEIKAFAVQQWRDFLSYLAQRQSQDPSVEMPLYFQAAGNWSVEASAIISADVMRAAYPDRGQDSADHWNTVVFAAEYLEKQGNPMIMVVALEHDNDKKLASYSNSCGAFKNYCIAAPPPTDKNHIGTSFSAPVVAASTALVMQKFPELSNIQVRDIILGTADDIGDSGIDKTFGVGRFNLTNALSPIGNLD